MNKLEQRLQSLEDYKDRHQSPRDKIAEHLEGNPYFTPYWRPRYCKAHDNTVGWMYDQEITVQDPIDIDD